jgi:hypothetical protein
MKVVSNEYRGSKEYFLAFSELIYAARHRGTTTYQELATIMELPLKGSYMGSAIGRLLGAISEDELERGRPMLSAVAVSVNGRPGKGFFGLAREKGLLRSRLKEDERAFWEQQKKAVYRTWQKKYKS